MQQLQVFEREARGKVGGRLNAPFEYVITARILSLIQWLGARSRSTRKLSSTIHSISNPYLRLRSTVSSTNCSAGRAFQLASVDAGVGAVGAIEGAGETGGPHRPKRFPHNYFIGVEVGQVVRLGGMSTSGLRGRGGEDQLVVSFESDARNKVRR